MNLWANRVGQLASLAVALFFFSCEDEASVLGFKNQNQKFEASYIEIPIESSVLLLDSQRTSNFVFQNETNRLANRSVHGRQVRRMWPLMLTHSFLPTVERSFPPMLPMILSPSNSYWIFIIMGQPTLLPVKAFPFMSWMKNYITITDEIILISPKRS